MAISLETINVGVENQSTGSDSLYTAFTKTQNNFSKLSNTASPYNTFNSGTGIQATANSSNGVVTITNTGVLNITAGTGLTASGSNGNITISVSGSGNGNIVAGVTSVGLSSNTLSISNSPIISNGTMSVNLPTIGTITSGSYTNPTLSVDNYGRITSIVNAAPSGTVTSVGLAPGNGISIVGGPVTGSGTITVTNTGVTRLNAGPGIALNSNTGEITITTTNLSGGTVTGVSVTSSSLVVTGSPITTTGVINIELPSAAGNFSANYVTANTALTSLGNASVVGAFSVTANTSLSNLTVSSTANVVGNLIVGSNISVAGSMTASGNAIINGNLTVNGTTEYTNVNNLYVKDPIIELGGNANAGALSSNDGKDRGTLLHYYTTKPVDAFMGWDNSNGEFAFGSNVTVSSEVATFNSFGNVRANYFLGDGSQLTSITPSNINGQVANSLVAATVYGNTQSNITSVGTLTSLTVSGNITSGNISGGNLVSANYLTLTANGNIAMSGSLSQLSGANVVSASYLTGTLTTAAQPNVTSVGRLSSLTVGNATANTSFGNGTITSSGNISSTGNITVAGNITANTNLFAVGGVFFYSNNGRYLGFGAPDGVATSYGWSWPGAEGSNGQFVSTNGAGVLSFKSPATGATPTSATATGTAGMIQYDATYLYICIAANTWRRIAHASW